MDAGWFWQVGLRADVSGHPEVRVLVDSLRNQAGELLLPEDVPERRGDAGGCLDGREGRLPGIPREFQAEDGLARGEVDMLLEQAHVVVHVANV